MGFRVCEEALWDPGVPACAQVLLEALGLLLLSQQSAGPLDRAGDLDSGN